MTPGSNISHLVTVSFLYLFIFISLCIKRVKAVSIRLVYTAIGEVQKGA